MNEPSKQQDPPAMEVTEFRDGPTLILAVAGRIDAITAELHDEVRDVFEISGFAKILEIHPNRDAAVAA